MSGIWVISDKPRIAWEMLSQARKLAGDEVVTAFVTGNKDIYQETVSFGADQVMCLEMPTNNSWEDYRDIILKAEEINKPSLIMVAATRRGKDLAAQLAALLDVPCVSECKSIIKDGPGFATERIVYGGLAVKKMVCTGCLVVTISQGIYEPVKHEGRKGVIQELKPQGFKTVVMERRPKPASSVYIAEAKIVIGVGRGFSSKEEIKMAEKLAKILDGSVGCTRPVAEDLRWLPEERYIGLSGQTVKPAMYLCAGVSGQVQHTYGIRDAKIIVAVDKNENAPIIQIADYYILGDLKEVLPLLTEACAKAK
ncbi:MAG: electron transfer flavoprotein subunit alpha/FixB family protein [Dehalobacterium sp.]|jgi:electron transfer flavoprotein alpha subunit